MPKFLESPLKSLKLGQKFTLLLSLIFFSGIAVSGLALSNILNNSVQHQITSEALMLMSTMNAVRTYTNTEVRPELVDRLKTEFLPETVPAFSAKTVFANLRKNKDLESYFYKEATLNPTNLEDKADEFESEVVKRFRQNKSLTEVNGFRSVEGNHLFYIARPITITNPSCLECHSTPDVAPQSMIQKYGSKNGFGWQLNETIGAQMISIPVSQVLQRTRQSFVMIMGLVAVVFAIAILMVNLWLKQYVVRPINRIARVAEAVSTGDLEAEFEKTSNDEVGHLVEAFTRLKLSLALAMQRVQKYQIGRSNVDSDKNNG